MITHTSLTRDRHNPTWPLRLLRGPFIASIIAAMALGVLALAMTGSASAVSAASSDTATPSKGQGSTFVQQADNTAPTVESVKIVSKPSGRVTETRSGRKRTTRWYGGGEQIRVQVRFSEPVIVKRDEPGAEVITVRLDMRSMGCPRDRECDARKRVAYARWTPQEHADTLEFTTSVLRADYSDKGLGVRNDSLCLWKGAEIVDRSGNHLATSESGDEVFCASHKGAKPSRKHKVDGILETPGSTPRVTHVRILSQPESGDTYAAGEAIWVRADLSVYSMLNRSRGNFTMRINVGSHSRTAVATYHPHHPEEGEYYTFKYVVQAEDNATGVSVPKNSMRLSSGTTLKSMVPTGKHRQHLNANLRHKAIGG